ncbi:hypothetical protein J2W48_004474 [Flavobacterium piscis]|uniref:Uncharacterized protein n=1 Tax=Flavobacterium piscis TaxID=1114874 RepID=A0ABU1YE38_9FLAO|nr:hypothetical protein [Flavobacterium piscis]
MNYVLIPFRNIKQFFVFLTPALSKGEGVKKIGLFYISKWYNLNRIVKMTLKFKSALI